MTLTNVEASAKRHYVETGGDEYALSCWASADLDLTGIVRAARAQGAIDGNRYIPHGSVQVATAGKIREVGYELTPDPPLGHYLLVLPNPPTDDDFRAVISAFGAKEPNPEGRMA